MRHTLSDSSNHKSRLNKPKICSRVIKRIKNPLPNFIAVALLEGEILIFGRFPSSVDFPVLHGMPEDEGYGDPAGGI